MNFSAFGKSKMTFFQNAVFFFPRFFRMLQEYAHGFFKCLDWRLNASNIFSQSFDFHGQDFPNACGYSIDITPSCAAYVGMPAHSSQFSSVCSNLPIVPRVDCVI